MIKSKKTSLIILLAMLMLSLSLALVMGVETRITTAATPEVFRFESGASVKITEEGGMRFRLQLDETTADAIKNAQEDELSFYVVPNKYYQDNMTVTDLEGLLDVDGKVHAQKVVADRNKIYLGQDNEGNSGYFSNCLLDINLSEFNGAYNEVDFIVVASWNGNLVKSAVRNLYSVINAAALDEYFDEVMTTYTWFGTEEYAINVKDTNEYTALVSALNDSQVDYTSKYIDLNDVEDTENLKDSYNVIVELTEEDYTALNTYLIEKERTSFKVDLTKVELTGNVTSVLFNDTSVDFTQEGNVITLANSVVGNPSVGSEVEISVLIGTTVYKLKCKAVSIVFTQADIDADVTFFSETFRRNATNASLAVTTGEYLLAEDLDFGGQEIGRIGQYASWVFSGTFDGQGYAIKNFKLTKATSGDDAKWANNALFAFVKNATIKNAYFEFVTADTFSVNNSTIGLVGAVYGGNLTMENVVSKMTLMGMPYATGNYGTLISSLVSWVEAGTLTLNNVVGIIETDVDVSATILEGKNYCGENWGTVNGTNVLYANSVSDNFATQLAGFTASGYFTKDGDTLKFGDEVV